MTKLMMDDRQLYYSCLGSGSPAVVIETGMGDTSDSWLHIQMAVSEFTRVLIYDRAGMGQSEVPPRPRTCQDMVGDLSALLKGAQIDPPYVLVGHSFGGLIVRLFARVREVYRKDTFTCKDDVLASHVALLMKELNVSGVVVSHNEALVGVVTDRDLRDKVLAKGLDPTKVSVSSIITEPPFLSRRMIFSPRQSIKCCKTTSTGLQWWMTSEVFLV